MAYGYSRRRRSGRRSLRSYASGGMRRARVVYVNARARRRRRRSSGKKDGLLGLGLFGIL